ncbi:MAG: hypothetical protein AB2L18_11160 [Anaerolineaceae bacterium]
MEHKSLKTAQIQSRHAFHIPADKIQNDSACLEQFITFAKSTSTQRVLVEVLSIQSLPVSAISSLIQNGIHVDVFLKTDLCEEFDLLAYQDLISNLAGLQVERVILFDRPNQQAFWKPETWIKTDLLDIFLEKYILLAEKCLEKNIQPVFPPLQPAGDYWDTAFLRLSLQKLKEKGKTALLESLMLSTYCWTYGHPLDWGAGGPERWPSSTPYYTPEDSQDQQGFRIYDWYQAHAKAVLNTSLPIMLLQAGRRSEYGVELQEPEPENQSATVRSILEKLYPDLVSGAQEVTSEELLPDEIIACNFLVDLDWDTLKSLFTDLSVSQVQSDEPEPAVEEQKAFSPENLQHYLLLPDDSWQTDARKAAILEPFLNRYHPVVGTSLDEALNAKEVTLVVTEQDMAEEKIAILEQNEAIVIRKMRLETSTVLEDESDH